MVVQLNSQDMSRALLGINSQTDKNQSGGTGLKNGSMFAGNTNLPSLIDEKRKSAQKQAMKIVSDAFAGERKLDATMQGIRDKVSALKDENFGLTKEIQANEEAIAGLAESYGIDPDSEEQKELELLHRYNMAKNKLADPLSLEEKKKAKALEANGLTEYQTRAIELYKLNDAMQKTVNDNNLLIEGNNAAIENMKIERLKTDPVGEATDEKDAIMDALSDEIKGMIVQDARRTQEEKAAEEKEKAEQREEKKEEEEEKLAAVKEREAELAELVENTKESASESEAQTERAKKANKEILEGASDMEELSVGAGIEMPQDQVSSEIQNILNKLKLLPEDIKGTTVDDML